ncbi:hypothetical protein IVB34_35450 [Bradyrhizobium sp. 2]|uniref:hypothetical protein n=1 Tax=Bradyrhizobium sp. 2 TaxID=190045 RepID=UPI001FF76EF4|nr:hypothetical protein [Bradyrhizobium sp. 2]MCK1463511.1 hypothetical protein [Bradyrhizobium sp. 2]
MPEIFFPAMARHKLSLKQIGPCRGGSSAWAHFHRLLPLLVRVVVFAVAVVLLAVDRQECPNGRLPVTLFLVHHPIEAAKGRFAFVRLAFVGVSTTAISARSKRGFKVGIGLQLVQEVDQILDQLPRVAPSIGVPINASSRKAPLSEALASRMMA